VGRPSFATPETESKYKVSAVVLGAAGSDPPAWLVDSVERKGDVVRLGYRKREAKSKDRHPYLFWAPLGELEPGSYALELFDAEKKEVTFLRRVTVRAPKVDAEPPPPRVIKP
jgi:hypothetical protein